MRTPRSSKAFGFVSADQRRLQQLLSHHTDTRTFIRLRSVLLVAQGHSVPTVAAMMGRSAQIVYRWIDTYLSTHDPASLLTQSKSGRPKTAVSITDNRILDQLALNPMDLGYKTTSWTVATLAHSLSQRFKCPITPATLHRRMKQLGLAYKRPKYFYEQKDPNRAQKKGPSSVS